MKSVFIILFMGIGVQLFAQVDFDSRLLSKFDKAQLQQLAENQSPVLDYWTYYLDHGYQVVDVPAGKSADAYPEIKYKSAKKFNILDLGVSMNRDTKKYYRIEGTNQMLLIYSSDEFSKLFNAHRQNGNN